MTGTNKKYKITKKQLWELGFIKNAHPCGVGFDEWVHVYDKRFEIGDFNGEGFLLNGSDWHEPIWEYHKLKQLVSVLTNQFSGLKKPSR